MNFNDLPFIDHHCHPYDTRKAILEPEFRAREFFHGIGDIPDLNLPKARTRGLGGYGPDDTLGVPAYRRMLPVGDGMGAAFQNCSWQRRPRDPGNRLDSC